MSREGRVERGGIKNIAFDQRALEQSLEAWVPVRRDDTLADWVPLVGSGDRRS